MAKVQFIKFPHDFGGKCKLTNLDRFIYGQLKRYMDWETNETFVSQARLAEDANTSQPTINKSLERLEKAGEIIIKRFKKGKSNIYKIKKDDRTYEMLSYDLLSLEIFSPELKGFYYQYQSFCYKDNDGFAKCTFTYEELAEKMHMSVNTIKKYFRELERLNVMSTSLTKVKDPVTGLLRDLRMVDLSTVCQATLYLKDRVENHEERIGSLEKTVKTLLTENKLLKKELWKQTHTDTTTFEIL